MKLAKKIVNRITLRCLGALLTGGMIVCLFSGMLTAYSLSDERTSHTDIAATMAFPQNEAALNQLAAELAAIETAAGE